MNIQLQASDCQFYTMFVEPCYEAISNGDSFHITNLLPQYNWPDKGCNIKGITGFTYYSYKQKTYNILTNENPCSFF